MTKKIQLNACVYKIRKTNRELVKGIILHLHTEISAAIKCVIGEDSDTESRIAVNRGVGVGGWGAG